MQPPMVRFRKDNGRNVIIFAFIETKVKVWHPDEEIGKTYIEYIPIIYSDRFGVFHPKLRLLLSGYSGCRGIHINLMVHCLPFRIFADWREKGQKSHNPALYGMLNFRPRKTKSILAS